MKTSQHLQKIAVGASLLILALGFSLIGVMSVLHPRHSGEAVEFNGISRIAGCSAGLAAGSIFFVAAFSYWRKYSSLAAKQPQVGARSTPEEFAWPPGFPAGAPGAVREATRLSQAFSRSTAFRLPGDGSGRQRDLQRLPR
jgi:hypothetical protein